MDKSEDLDLDSLMELLDETSETENKPAHLNKIISPKQEEKSAIVKKQASLVVVPLNLSPEKHEQIKKSNTVNESSLVHTGDTDSSEDEDKKFLTDEGILLKKKINKLSNYSFSSPKLEKTKTWKHSSNINRVNSSNKVDKLYTDAFSGIRIVNPLVPYDIMQQKMNGRKMIKMSFIKNFIRGGDIEGDWVTIGVVIYKVPPKTTKTGKTFSIWKMTDLHDCEKIVSMFLFGAAHTEHWKTTIGTVIGFLNPSILPDKDKNGDLSLSVDHAGKLMILGQSKDFGHCKGRKKDGGQCTSAVNLSQCEYCIYHVKKEYQKFSAKRSELQASYSGREPSLKDRLLKKQNVFYGGQMFSPSEKIKKSSKQNTPKDKLTLLNLGLKRKAEVLENEEKNKNIKKLTELYGPAILSTAENNSDFINGQLAIPTAGSRNLLHHMMKEKEKKEGENVKVITPKELLKMRDSMQKNKGVNQQQSDSTILKNLVPQIGKGLKPGQIVSLDSLSSKSTKICTAQEFAKLKAIQKIKHKGPLKPQDPNSVKCSSDSKAKVAVALNSSFEESSEYVEEEEISFPKSSLGNLSINPEKMKEILNRKSSHAYEVETEEIEKQASYFNNLEKKEQMELKMASTTEIVCDVVSCKQCKYTAHHATDLCKNQGHLLKCHKAVKRFFSCKDCKRRTCCFTKFPKRSCRNCRGSNFERTSMLKPRAGPKLDSETLNIRGDEIKFLNSLK